MKTTYTAKRKEERISERELNAIAAKMRAEVSKDKLEAAFTRELNKPLSSWINLQILTLALES